MITPKKAPLPPIGQKQLSQELNKIFPDVDNAIKEKADTFKEQTLDINELVEKVGRDEKSEATFEFEFFSGGKNSKFDSFVKKFGLTTENINFIDFLQSEYCKEILQNNNLKIHIETGNIYYDDKDTNESIFEFIQNQQNTSKGIIRYDFKFDRNFRDYFKWILNEFDAQQKTTFDVLAHKNVKFLANRYNDLRASGSDELIKIRHSLVTDNYLADEEIRNQGWQFFIERVLEVCKFNDANLIKPGEKFLLSTIENVTVAKRVYRMIFDTVSRNSNLTINDLIYGRIKDISDDFSIENYSYRDSITNLNDWISYYYLYRKFTGLDEFVNVPYHKKPYFLKTETQLSPSNLYSKFSATTANGLVSFHALCAFNIYLDGSKDISKLAYEEVLKSLSYQALSEENDETFLSFDQAISLAHSIINTLVDITREENKSISEISEQINEKLVTNFEFPAMEIQLGVEPEQLDEPVQASTPPAEKEIRAFHDKEKTDYLKKTLKLNAIDLESAAEVADSENEKLFQEIINPTPGLTLDDQMNDVDEQFSYRHDPNQDYTLPSPLKTRLDDILQEAREKINSIAFPSPAIEEIPK